MHSITPNYLNSLSFTEQQLSTLKLLGEYQGKQGLFLKQTPEILSSLRQAALIESSESSNRIEGITAPHHRIEAIVLESTSPKNRSEQEIAGYRDALNLIHESAKYMPFSINIVLQLHNTLYKYLGKRGGHWKITDNEIVERYSDGTIKKIRFKPTPAVATAQAMEDLVSNYRHSAEVMQYESLVVIPLTIFDFLCIHPFTDGNGRTSRLVTLMLLYQSNVEVGRYISLERLFEETKETYYEALERSSKNWHQGQHEINPWLNYFWGILLRAYREFEERVGKIQTGKGYKTEQIISSVNKKIGLFSIADIERECPGVSRDMVRKILRQLRDKGIIKAIGTGRSARWIKNI